MPYVEYFKHRKIVNALLQLTYPLYGDNLVRRPRPWWAGESACLPGTLKIQGGQTAK